MTAAVLAGVVFVGLFAMWVVLPSRLRKRAEQTQIAVDDEP